MRSIARSLRTSGSWTALVALVVAGSACGAAPGTDDDDGDDDAPVPALTFPQAHRGAFAASPWVYATIPVRVAVDGAVDGVVVTLDGDEVAAVPGAAGEWVASLPIAGRADGAYPLVARAVRGGVEASATVELVLRASGAQITSVPTDGNAGTPRLHRVDDALYLTWTDGRDDDRRRKARVVELDGAGRFVGAPTVLVDDVADVLYARTAIGGDAVGVLYQQAGGPYTNRFTVVGLDGVARVAPIDLDPVGAYGSYGGDVAFDGEAFVLVWRVNDGAGRSHVRWARVTPAGEVTGPVVVAAAGDDDPHGGFEPFTVIGVEAVGDRSVVAFTRHLYDATLELTLPQCELVAVDRDGAAGPLAYATSGWMWHHECRVLGAAGAAVLVWGSVNLSDPSSTPPTSLRAARIGADATLDPARGAGAVLVEAADHRTEPAMLDGVAAWLDERSYVVPQDGRIELYVAPVSADLVAGAATVVPHARFIEGTSELGLASLGANRLLVWIDERHGGGVTDPRPEVWIETAWY